MASSNPVTSDSIEVDAPGEAQLLVSEFPPPPFYYKQASGSWSLVPPVIPTEALERGTRRAAAVAAKARAESDRMRLGEDTAPNSDAILGGTTEQEEGDVVAVFGEIVEVRWRNLCGYSCCRNNPHAKGISDAGKCCFDFSGSVPSRGARSM